MFTQSWFWMYVIGISMVKANVYNATHYENNPLIRYSNIVYYVALILFVFLVAFLSPHWWWGPVMWILGWVSQGIQTIIRNPIRLMSAMHGSRAGNVFVRSIEMIAAPVLTILAYLFFFYN